MIIYLDLDRTLFRTGESLQIWQMIQRIYPQVDGVAAYEGRDRYYATTDDLYCYDMSAQLRDLGLDPETVYSELRKTELADGRFEYPGCSELVQSLEQYADPQILTFGTDDYQRFKASLCPSLRGLAVTTTRRPKAEVLHDSEVECWLVDDKPIGDELPPSVSFVQVAFDTAVEPDVSWPVFESLEGVRYFFEDVFADHYIDN